MEASRISLGDAFARIPNDVDDVDFGRSAKRQCIEESLGDTLRTQMHREASSSFCDRVSSVTTPLGIAEGQSVVFIPGLYDNDRLPPRSDGKEWPADEPTMERNLQTQPYQRRYYRETLAPAVQLANAHPSARFVNMLAALMKRSPSEFYNQENIKALEEQRQWEAHKRSLDAKRKFVGHKGKMEQIDALKKQETAATENLNRLVSESHDASSSHRLSEENVAEFFKNKIDNDAVLLNTVSGATCSLLHFDVRRRLMDLVVRVADLDNPDVFIENKPRKQTLTATDIDSMKHFISLTWPKRYDKEELAASTLTTLCQKFLAAWFIHVLAKDSPSEPTNDFKMATHMTAFTTRLLGTTLLELGLTGAPTADIGKMMAMLENPRFSSGDGHINRATVTTLGSLFDRLLELGAFVGKEPVALPALDLMVVEETREILKELESGLSNIIVRETQGATMRALRATTMSRIQQPVRTDPATTTGVSLNLDTLAVLHAVTASESIRAAAPGDRPMLWTNFPSLTMRHLLEFPALLEMIHKVGVDSIYASDPLIGHLAVLARNLVLITNRPDIPLARGLAEAFGWINMGTIERIWKLAWLTCNSLGESYARYLLQRETMPQFRRIFQSNFPFSATLRDPYLSTGDTGTSESARKRTQVVFDDTVATENMRREREVALMNSIFLRIRILSTLHGEVQVMREAILKAYSAPGNTVANETLPRASDLDALWNAIPTAVLYYLALKQRAMDDAEIEKLRRLIDKLKLEITRASEILASIAAEDPHRRHPPPDLDGRIREDPEEDDYTQSLEWTQQPFISGVVILSQTLLGLLDIAQARVEQNIPSLRGIPLEVLTTHFDSGLAPVFARLVSTIDTESELLHDREVIRREMYKETKHRLFEVYKALHEYSYSRGDGNTVTVIKKGRAYRSQPPGSARLEGRGFALL